MSSEGGVCFKAVNHLSVSAAVTASSDAIVSSARDEANHISAFTFQISFDAELAA